jgi:hypothetical protein
MNSTDKEKKRISSGEKSSTVESNIIQRPM